MSGIAGVLGTDGRPADPRDVQRMLQAMSHRGPNGSAVETDGSVALGHCLLRAVPEEQAGPIVAGDLMVTADVRLDNRSELADALGLNDSSVPDARLIGAAYARWGDDCAAHLLGDFAFAIWDREKRHLVCARDHFGVKPFYYHSRADGFAFASEIKPLFTLAGVTRRVDEARIADYLVSLPADERSTLYADIRRVPPGHILKVADAGVHEMRYWRLDPLPIQNADPAEQFGALFAEAVRCRLRSADKVGAMLSGGLDSSAIACVAAPMERNIRGGSLATLSLVFDKTPAWSERPFIEAVLAGGGFDPSFQDCDGYAPFADFDLILVEQEGVFNAPGLAVSRQLYRAAAGRGLRVLLDGHGGDEVVSHGWGRLHELALANRWFALWREVRGVAGTYNERGWQTFLAYLRGYGPGRQLKRVKRVAAKALGRRPKQKRPGWSRFLNPDLVRRSDLVDRYTTMRRAETKATGSERTRHAWLLSSGRVPQSFEVLDRAAASASVEPRYPFWDKRLVEFCLALPPEEKLNGGWPRLILRRAMQGILPPAVQWRRDKLDFAPHIVRGMLLHHRHLIDRILIEDGDGIGRYVDLPVMRAAYGRLVDRVEAADGHDVQAVWRTVALALWLRQLNGPSLRKAAA